MSEISIDEFMKIDLRVAKIIEAEKVAGSDKLIRMIIDLGEEKRQIVAGISPWYKPEDLVGKLIVVIKNLAPKKIRGIMSHGMLLAADTPEKPVLLTVMEDVPPGTRVR